jgi:hypothetical protein
MKKQDWISCVNCMTFPGTVTNLSAVTAKPITYQDLYILPIMNYGTGVTVCGGMAKLSPGVLIMNGQEHVS